MRYRGRGAVIVALVGLGLGLPPAVEAQARRGVQQRQQRSASPQTDAPNPRQAEILLDRFAERAGQALRLNRNHVQRLRRELQASRQQRNAIRLESRQIRQELGQLVQQDAVDEARLGELLDAIVELEVRAVQVTVDEQRRLAEFLTPLQRARVMWLQQRLARQAAERQSGRTDVPPSDRPGGVP